MMQSDIDYHKTVVSNAPAGPDGWAKVTGRYSVAAASQLEDNGDMDVTYMTKFMGYHCAFVRPALKEAD